MNGRPIETISCAQLFELRQRAEIDLIDVRTPEEFCEVRATGARNVPLDTLDPRALIHGRAAQEPLYFICHLGVRSAVACEMVAASGFANVVNVLGGTDAWLEAGLPAEWGEGKATPGDKS